MALRLCLQGAQCSCNSRTFRLYEEYRSLRCLIRLIQCRESSSHLRKTENDASNRRCDAYRIHRNSVRGDSQQHLIPEIIGFHGGRGVIYMTLKWLAKLWLWRSRARHANKFLPSS